MKDLETVLSAYVDGELDAAAAAEVEALLATDAQAQRLVEMYRETGALLRAAMAEPFFAEGSHDLLDRPRMRTERVGWPIAWTIAASILACVIGFGGGTVWGSWSAGPRDAMIDEVAEYHAVYSRETVHLVEVPAAQAEHLRTWLGHRIERRLDIPDLTVAGLHFAGGRMLVIGGKPAANLTYTRDRGAPIALCVVQSEGPAEELRVERRGGLRVAIWQDGHYAYLIVGDLDPGMARGIAERAAEQIKG